MDSEGSGDGLAQVIRVEFPVATDAESDGQLVEVRDIVETDSGMRGKEYYLKLFASLYFHDVGGTSYGRSIQRSLIHLAYIDAILHSEGENRELLEQSYYQGIKLKADDKYSSQVLESVLREVVLGERVYASRPATVLDLHNEKRKKECNRNITYIVNNNPEGVLQYFSNSDEFFKKVFEEHVRIVSKLFRKLATHLEENGNGDYINPKNAHEFYLGALQHLIDEAEEDGKEYGEIWEISKSKPRLVSDSPEIPITAMQLMTYNIVLGNELAKVHDFRIGDYTCEKYLFEQI